MTQRPRSSAAASVGRLVQRLRAAASDESETLRLNRELQAELSVCREMLTEMTEGLRSMDERVGGLEVRLDHHRERALAEYQRTLHALRMVRDDDARAWENLWRVRRESDYELAYTEEDPLVTVIITTYRNWELLGSRALPSVLAQTHSRWECLVMGDAAPPETAEVVASFADPRISFHNLPMRGPYPDQLENAWLVWGGVPYNTGLKLGQGRWFAFVSDDDALAPDHLQSLLALARRERAELAYGQMRFLYPDEPEVIKGTSPPPEFGTWGLQCSLFHSALTCLPLFHNDWVFSVPIDWSWVERLFRIGVRFAALPEPVVDYFPSRRWNDRPELDAPGASTDGS